MPGSDLFRRILVALGAGVVMAATAAAQPSVFPPTLDSVQVRCVEGATAVTVMVSGTTTHSSFPSNPVLTVDGSTLRLTYEDAEWCGIHLQVIVHWTLTASASPVPAGMYDLQVQTTPKPGDCATPRGPVSIGRVEVVEPCFCRADFNRSGGVSVQDIFDFLGAYFSNDLQADFNHSGGVSVQDIFDYLGAYFLGCG
jgi:hypothetical protein